MTQSAQPRASRITRCTAALAVLSFTATAIAQIATPQTPVPAAEPAQQPVSAPNGTTQTVAPTPNKHQADAAEAAYLAGARFVEKKNLAAAENEFSKAVKLNPGNRDYLLALSFTHDQHISELVQQAGKARLLGQSEKADTLLAEARLLDPEDKIAPENADPGAAQKIFHPEIESWLKQGPGIAGPVTLEPKADNQSFHLHSNEQDVITKVLAGYGIRPIFDDSVQRKDVRFDLEDSPYQQAVPILLEMTHLFAVPLDAHSVVLAKDTPENRERFERQLQETIYIPGMANDEMDQLGNVIKQIFDVKQVSVEKSSGLLVIRAPQNTLTYINLTLADLIDGGSQVMIELKLYSVDKTNQRNIGSQLPQQIGIYNVASQAQSIVSANQSLVNQAISQGLVPATASNITIALALIASGLVQSTLLSSTVGFFGGGITATGVTTNQNLAFSLALTSSTTHALNDMQIRTGDHQQATFRVGQRYPITTSTYTNGITGTSSSALSGVSINGVSAASLLGSSTTSLTIPQIQYEDLGLTLKTTPTIQRSGAILMHLDLTISSLSGSSLSNIPILDNQHFISDVTVNDGDTAVIASTISKTQTGAISGWPGISALPGFQQVTADTTTMTDDSELLLLVTPRVTRRRPSVSAGPRIAVDLHEQSN